MKILVVVDAQVDFVSGVLGSPEAKAAVPAVVETIDNFDGKIYATLDTHSRDYMETSEGKHLPVPHCIRYTPGWALEGDIAAALYRKTQGFTAIEKCTFGTETLPRMIDTYLMNLDWLDDDELEIVLVGYCTDICVVSNALILKTHFPNADIVVDSRCCAGVTPEKHEAALEVLRSCQIHVL